MKPALSRADAPANENASATDQAGASRSKGVLRIGTAGWSVPKAVRGAFPATGSHLERYAARLNCVEINSSFYRPHQKKTYERWARSTPEDFRFAVKLPQSISHADSLEFTPVDLERFIGQIRGLGVKFGLLLVQLPPRLAFDETAAGALFDALRRHVAQPIACEPRHASWFDPAVDEWMAKRKVARVAADPARISGADQPGGWRGLCYVRLHGSPRTYYSSYDADALAAFASKIKIIEAEAPVWCILDNTAAGAAMENALVLQHDLKTKE
jgi:uncharacterized protein YecE (DUF72 family)